jgi:hypothetical protein
MMNPEDGRLYVSDTTAGLFGPASIEAAARGICDQGILALNAKPATWERHADGLRGMADAALTAAVAALDVGELVERVTTALAHGELHDEGWLRCRRAAVDAVAALGIPVPAEQEETR